MTTTTNLDTITARAVPMVNLDACTCATTSGFHSPSCGFGAEIRRAYEQAEREILAETVRVRGLNVNALQVAIDSCSKTIELEGGIVRMGATFVEGTRAALESLAGGAEECAEDNWEELTNGWGEMSDAFAEVVLERKRAALTRAVAKVRAAIA